MRLVISTHVKRVEKILSIVIYEKRNSFVIHVEITLEFHRLNEFP